MADENDNPNWATERAALETAHAAALAAITGERDAAVAGLRDFRLTHELTAAIKAAGGTPEFLLPKVRAAVTLVPGENGAEESLAVVGPDGKPRLREDGTAATLADVLGELQTDETWSRAFKASGASGGGAVGSGSRTNYTGPNPYLPGQANRTLQAQLERDNPTLAARLQSAAKK